MYIQLKDVNKTIQGNPILCNINMRLESGRIYGLQGKNGSGKTMLMRALCGLIRYDSGQIDIDGKILGKDISFPESVGFLIENPGFLPGETGLENLKLLAAILNRVDEAHIRDVVEKVGLNPNDLRKYKKYSLGMKQRLGIAAAIMEDPDLILLDEPTNAIDEDGIVLLRGILDEYKKKGALIVLSCHDTEELNLLSDEIFAISKGKVVDHRMVALPADNFLDSAHLAKSEGPSTEMLSVRT